MIFVESYFKRSLKRIVFDKLKQTTNLSVEKQTISNLRVTSRSRDIASKPATSDTLGINEPVHEAICLLILIAVLLAADMLLLKK